jgi:hypothetical protein
MELLKAMQEMMDAYEEKMLAAMDANSREMMAKLDVHHARTMACLGKTEATDLEANPENMESRTKHREAPRKKQR